MKGEMKTSHAVAILAIVAILIIGYYSVTSYQNQQNETQTLLTDQQKALQDAQQKIADLQKSNEQNKQAQATAQKNASDKTNQNNITTSEVSQLLTGVVEIKCGTTGGYIQGSGSLWKINGKYIVLTNEHVVSSSYSDGSCGVSTSDETDKPAGSFSIYPANATSWNTATDVATLDLFPWSGGVGPYSPIIEKQNYAISTLGQCPSTMVLGAPVVIIGYPAFAQITSQPFNSQGDTVKFDSRTVTNGIISAYDSIQSKTYGSFTGGSLPYQDYFVSNTIDHGNSGGIALSKYNGSLCVLGIPTWLNQGVSNNQGIVQNINNVMWKGK